MYKYILGWLKNIINPAVSIFSLIDNVSYVSNKAKIHRGAKVFNSKIGRYTYLTKGSESVFAEIGNFCSIGHYSKIGLAHHDLKKLSTSPIFLEKINATGSTWNNHTTHYPYKKVIIENDVWIGSRALLIGGIKISNGAVIAAGSIVTKDVPPYAVVAGVPARIVKYRFKKSLINNLLSIQWWNLPEQLLRENLELFNNENLNTEELQKKLSI